MVLISFSEPDHIPKIFDGRKRQTTRQPRKNPIKVGDTVQLYYRSRMSKDCKNCINQNCQFGDRKALRDTKGLIGQRCGAHTNFFGTAKITSVGDLDFDLLSPGALDVWAVADGFESWEQANKWFSTHHGAGPNWTRFPWVVIKWEPNWLGATA